MCCDESHLKYSGILENQHSQAKVFPQSFGCGVSFNGVIGNELEQQIRPSLIIKSIKMFEPKKKHCLL